jgi:hypothetical protein
MTKLDQHITAIQRVCLMLDYHLFYSRHAFTIILYLGSLRCVALLEKGCQGFLGVGYGWDVARIIGVLKSQCLLLQFSFSFRFIRGVSGEHGLKQ